MRTLSPRESRLVAVLLLVALVALVNFALVQPLWTGFADRAAERDALRARYAANARLVAAVPRLAREAAARRRDLGAYVLAPADAASAGDFLRSRLQAELAAIGGEYRGGEDLAGAPGLAASRISARVPSAALVPLLARIQNLRPAITIGALSVSAGDALVTGEASAVEVQLDVSIPYRAAASR